MGRRGTRRIKKTVRKEWRWGAEGDDVDKERGEKEEVKKETSSSLTRDEVWLKK